jgi:hypothetical protein
MSNNDNVNNVNNGNTIYYYSYDTDETSFFEIKEYKHKTINRFRTSISLNNSHFQYVTYFNTILEALNYVKKHQFKNQECL